MKRYKNLWDEFISMENLNLAAKKAVKSKKNKKLVKYFLDHQEELLKKLQDDLLSGRFRTSEYVVRTIYEPKKRNIYILPLYPDHVVHHALINILGPIWQSGFVNDSFACIPGRGLHKASHRAMHFVRKYKYVLQCDVRKFYPSINHEIMFGIIKRKICDQRLLKVLYDIIYSVGGETNLPIGNLTSQWMGNVYLDQMDHYIKEVMRCHAYVRYCDDFLIFGDDKAQLHRYKEEIKEFLMRKLALQFSKSSVYPVKNGVTFVGYRHFKDFILLRRYSAKKMIRRITNIVVHGDDSDKSSGQLAAFHGWIKWSCSYNFKKSILKMTRKRNPHMKKFIIKKFFIPD